MTERDFLVLELEAVKDKEPRRAAEIAYVLAHLYLKERDIEAATRYGRESIRLFDKCPMETLEQCAAVHVVLAGVALPSYIHQDVVRQRFQPLKL